MSNSPANRPSRRNAVAVPRRRAARGSSRAPPAATGAGRSPLWPPLSSRSRSISPARSPVMPSAALRAVASSIASGIPSSCAHSSPTAAGSASNCASSVRARSKNSATASESAAPPVDGATRDSPGSGDDPLPGHPDARAARRQHEQLGRLAEQRRQEVRGVVHQVLAVVQHEQGPPRPQPREHRVTQRLPGPFGHAEHRRHRLQEEARTRADELDERRAQRQRRRQLAAPLRPPAASCRRRPGRAA